MQSAFDEIPGFASTRLLLVDDNPKLCRMVKEYLEPVGYEVAVAHTEPEGLRKALEGDFHAIILDVMLPGPDGFEVLRTSMERSKALVSVVVRDSEGSQRAAEVIFASPNQVNFVVPGGTAPGAATVTISSGEGWELTGDMFVQTVAPALFTANATGSGVAAAMVLYTRGDGSRTVQLAFECNLEAGQCAGFPIDVGPSVNQAYLSLYGTGIRFFSGLSEVTVWIGGEEAEVLYAGPQGQYAGLDQVDVLVPKTLAGHGDVIVRLTVGGKEANPVTVSIG